MTVHQSLVVVAAVIVGTFSITQHGDAEPRSEPKGNVIEFLTHPKSDSGIVVCALFDKSGWLMTPVKPAWGKIKGNRALCVFNDVRPGTYGISAYHDANKNGKLDTNVLGMPIEDYCASRDARATFSAPPFEDAKFQYKGGNLRMSARLK